MTTTNLAVMANRASSLEALDFFPTQPWGTRALCEHLIDLSGASVWEPACGRGDMARVLAEYAAVVSASDVYPYGFGAVFDFLSVGDMLEVSAPQPDWIITNPPFKVLLPFARLALRQARRGVALLVRTSAVSGIRRYNALFKPWEGHFTFAPFTERLPLFEGRLDPKGSTATDYAWLIIDKAEQRSPLIHIPPCRARLERADDYPPESCARFVPHLDHGTIDPGGEALRRRWWSGFMADRFNQVLEAAPR